MSIIPSGLYHLGKSTYAIERRCSFLSPDTGSALIASATGMTAPSAANDDCYKFAATANGGSSGFTTTPFVMHSASGSNVVIAAEMEMFGYYSVYARRDELLLSDGTNSIKVTSTSGDFDANTTYTATLGSVTTSGTLAYAFNINALYAACRGLTNEPIVRQNLRFRVDKNRSTISLWLGEQIKGSMTIAGLESLGTCTFQYTHKLPSGATFSNPAFVKQIGWQLEC